MTQTTQHSIFVYNYTEPLLASNIASLYTALLKQQNFFKKKGIKGIFISLKSISYIPSSENYFSLVHLVKQLEKLTTEISLPVAIGDYTQELFEDLKKISTDTSIKLFQSLSIATLFFNPTSLKKEFGVLVYDEDATNTESISSELVKFGYSVVTATSKDDFDAKIALKKYDMTIVNSAINRPIHLNSKANKPSKSLALSKQLILNLPVFIDTAVNSLVTITGLEAQKIKHDIKPFDEKITSNVIISSMRFKGDVSGVFFLVFPKELALVALEAMLGETLEPNDTEAIIDGVSEFCNIITGASKVIFSNKNLKVLFELPKTYISPQIALGDTLGANGVWIDMQLADKPFYMFITK